MICFPEDIPATLTNAYYRLYYFLSTNIIDYKSIMKTGFNAHIGVYQKDHMSALFLKFPLKWKMERL